MSSVSKNIRKIRLQKNFTQEEIANKLFVTRQTISNWENGKSQPDLDMIIKIAETLDIDINLLIYGVPDSAYQKKDKKHLILSGAILLIISISIYFIKQIVIDMKSHYFLEPEMLQRLFFLPVFWLILGWTFMQGFGVLGLIKPIHSKYSKTVQVTVLAIVMLYVILMLPFFKEAIKDTFQSFQFRKNPSLYGNSYSYVYNIPKIISKIEQPIINIVFKKPFLFIIPSIIFWLSKPNNQKRGCTKSEL